MPTTFLTGQRLNADTSSPLPATLDLRDARINSELLSGAEQFRPALPFTVQDQERPANEQAFLDYVTRPTPKATDSKAFAILRPRQLWDGTVVECTSDSFVARVKDRTNPSNPDELVTFEIEEVSPEDRKLIQHGAAFYWTIGSEQSPAGQIRNIDMVNFRRLPGWSRTSLMRAEEEASEIVDSLFSDIATAE